jgi:GDPmannose 4,6-dehydratase
MKTALITGVLGQDGAYLAEHLLGLGYRVVGTVRRPIMPSQFQSLAMQLLLDGKVEFVYADMRDELSVRTAIRKSWPDEIYNLAGQVYVPLSWEMPAETLDVNCGGLSRILKTVEQVKKDTKVYQASSSEMFGNHEGECDEKTVMAPSSPYGISKLAAHRLVGVYRDRGLFVVGGILFNHESPRRGPEMVTRKIAKKVAEWATGSEEKLYLGNLDSRRDWGFAGEYVKAMHLMLQQEKPDDYVVGTGISHSVGELVRQACLSAGVSDKFMLEHMETDDRMKRTQEIHSMRANNAKIKEILGWEPQMKFEELVNVMVTAELFNLKNSVKNMGEVADESLADA